MKPMLWTFSLFAAAVLAQDVNRATNSLFDNSELKTFAVKSIMVEGEVENPGLVDLNQLPLRSIAVKELAQERGKQVFLGAFLFYGWSLSDVLNSKKVKKAAGNTFSPPIDLYAVVENNKGEKTAVSWGEIYYTRDGSNILISKSVRAINPANGKTKWPLPEEPRLICGNDLLNVRFLSNPTKITVKSYRGIYSTEKPKNMYSPEIKILMAGNTAGIADIGSSVEKRRWSSVGYGHGAGFKEVATFTGFLLKDLIDNSIKVRGDDLSNTLAVVSAKDGYHSVFSASEIMNRNDNQDILLIDKKDAEDGRYTLFVGGFFVDRNVKAVEKIELVSIK